MLVTGHETEDLQGLGQRFRRFVRTIRCAQGLEDIGDSDHPVGNAHVVFTQPARVTGAVHFLVVVAGNARHTLEVAR
ncbi:hypothetical protein D3C77_395570 [compost metagenome]